MLLGSLSADLGAPDWPALTEVEVADVAAAYPALAGPFVIRWRSPRPWSAAAIVGTANPEWPSVFVKRHHRAVRTGPQLAEEHRFMEHLRAAGQPVAPVLAAGDGQTVRCVEPWVYEIQAVAPGVDCYRDTPSWVPFRSTGHARSAGAALADLHRVAADFSEPARSTELLVSRFDLFAGPDPVAGLAEAARRRPGLARFLAGRDWQSDVAHTLLPYHRVLLPLLEGLVSSWAHNDWHASNLLWSGPEPDAAVRGIMDFGLADRTSAVYDVATGLERNALAWLELRPGHTDIARVDLADAFLAGYWSRRPWSEQEEAVLPALLPLVHVELALSEVAYYAGVAGRPDTAEVAYHQFLLGHAAWFSSQAGQSFLAHMRAWGHRLRLES